MKINVSQNVIHVKSFYSFYSNSEIKQLYVYLFTVHSLL